MDWVVFGLVHEPSLVDAEPCDFVRRAARHFRIFVFNALLGKNLNTKIREKYLRAKVSLKGIFDIMMMGDIVVVLLAATDITMFS